MKSMNLRMGIVVAAAVAMLLGAGCMDQGEPSDDEAVAVAVQAASLTAEKPEGDIGINAVASFYSTCTSPSVTYDSSGAITHAFAKECRRRNGSWYPYPQDWYGRCTTNLGNCDGILRCGC